MRYLTRYRGTEKRKLEDDLRLRMFLFDVLVIGVLMYGVKQEQREYNRYKTGTIH